MGSPVVEGLGWHVFCCFFPSFLPWDIIIILAVNEDGYRRWMVVGWWGGGVGSGYRILSDLFEPLGCRGGQIWLAQLEKSNNNIR